MRFPWISREHHREVVQAKDDLIHSLEQRIAALQESIAHPAKIVVTLPDDFAVQDPAVVRRKSSKKAEPAAQEAKPQEPVDWENIDEKDLVTISRLAAQELGGPSTPYALASTVSRIQAHIRAAHVAKVRRIVQKGTVGTIVPPTINPEKPEEPQQVPEHIKRMIENAERV